MDRTPWPRVASFPVFFLSKPREFWTKGSAQTLKKAAVRSSIWVELEWRGGKQLRAIRVFPQSNAPISSRVAVFTSTKMEGTRQQQLFWLWGSKYNRGLLANVSGGGEPEVSNSIWSVPTSNATYKVGLCFDRRGSLGHITYLKSHCNTRVAKPDQQLFAVRPLSTRAIAVGRWWR